MTNIPQRRLEDQVQEIQEFLSEHLGKSAYRHVSKRLNQVMLQAYTDTMTGLLRADTMELAFDSFLKAIEDSRLPYASFSFLMLDHDKFKEVNDSKEGYVGKDGVHYTGHPAGDALLKDSAAVIKDTLRYYDLILRGSEQTAQTTVEQTAQTVAVRYGGDEFIIGIPFAGLDEPTSPQGFLPFPEMPPAAKIGERLRRGIKEATKGHTVSIGIANYPRTSSHADLKTLTTQADRALYAAKNDGGDCCRIWRPEYDIFTGPSQ